MSVPVLTHRNFQHRIPITAIDNVEDAANKLGMIGNRTHALLSVLLNILFNESEPDSEQLIAVVEAAIGEAKDMQEVAFMIELAARDQDKNSANEGGVA